MYTDWNSKINVISRKDITNLYEPPGPLSLVIAKVLNSRRGTEILDWGTGEGSPEIPLAISFRDSHFHLTDSMGKKGKGETEVAKAIGKKNLTTRHCRAEEEKQQFDFVGSRAVMPLGDLIRIVRKNIRKEQSNSFPNGVFCLKGGDLTHEVAPFKHWAEVIALSDIFSEEYFKTKEVVYVTVN